MGFGILDHLLDVGVGKPARSLDADLLLLAGGLVLGGDADNAVGVDVERDFDLRHAARRGRNALQVETAQRLVVGRHLAFALEHIDGDGGLVVLGGGENLAFLVGMVVLRSISRVKTPPRVSMPSDSGVTSSRSTSLTSPFSTPPWIAAPMATTSSGLTPLCGSLPNSCLTASCTLGMRVMPPTRITSSIWLRGDAGILQRLLHRADGLLDQIIHQAFQLGAGDLDGEMLGARRIRGDEGQIDFGLLRARKLDLGLFRRVLQALQAPGGRSAGRCRSPS